MPRKTILFSGSSAVGKTSVLRTPLPYMREKGESPMVCKIDCLMTKDAALYQSMGIPAVSGVSRDICPDHFLVSNLPELWDYADRQNCSLLFIKTAGLYHRCSPATVHSIAGCILGCTASCRAPGQLGLTLLQVDFIVPTKTDMVSQAELEIVHWNLKELSPGARIFPVDVLAGYGVEFLGDWLLFLPDSAGFEHDCLCHTMPAGVCSYCAGEQRVGSSLQQGVMGKIDFQEVLW